MKIKLWGNCILAALNIASICVCAFTNCERIKICAVILSCIIIIISLYMNIILQKQVDTIDDEFGIKRNHKGDISSHAKIDGGTY